MLLFLAAFVMPPLLARPIYALACLQRCRRADRLGLSGPERQDYLERAGGVSWLGGGLAMVFWCSVANAILKGVLPHGVAAMLP